MARLRRRGIGKFHIDRIMLGDKALRSRFDGLEAAYEEIWADAEKCIGDHENSWFWALMFRGTCELMAPMVRDISKMMDKSILTAMMRWNAGEISASAVAESAWEDFGEWFRESLMPEHDRRCGETDKKFLSALNGFIRERMEREGLRPIELKYICTDDYYSSLRCLIQDELLPTLEVKMKALVPAEIRDSRLRLIRRGRLRRGLDSFHSLKSEQGAARVDFITDVLISEKLELDHANSLLHALGRSIVGEELYLMG